MLFVPLQLVREADLGQPLSAARGAADVAGGNAELETRLRARTTSGSRTTFSASASIGFAISRPCSQPAGAACRSRFSCARTSRLRAWPRRCGQPAAAKCGSAPKAAARRSSTRCKGNARRRSSCRRVAPFDPKDIRVGFFLMLGYVGEELDDILATRESAGAHSARRHRRQRCVPVARHEVLRSREARARRETQLGREQRSRH